VVVHGDGEEIRDFTHVDDGVRANLLAMQAPILAEAIDVGGGRRVTVNEVLDLIGRYSGRRLKVERVKAQASDARHTAPTAPGPRRCSATGPRSPCRTAGQAAWVAQRLGLRPPARARSAGR
jgi:UDP-glucuronate 4-epimerase